MTAYADNFSRDLAEASKVAQSVVPSTVGPSALVSQRSRHLAVGTSTRAEVCRGLVRAVPVYQMWASSNFTGSWLSLQG